MRKLDIFGRPIIPPAKCKNCGREKGKHKAGTLACPLTKHEYTHFSQDKFYEPKEKK